MSRLSAHLTANGIDLYAVLDGARDEAIHALTKDVGLPWMYFEDGIVEASYQICAPRVIGLGRKPSAALERLLQAGWGRDWGIFVHATVDFGQLRRHLRTLSHAKLPSGRIAQFRFYDPRVLRAYLPTCFAAELAQVFGPITQFTMAGADPSSAWAYRLEDGALCVDELGLVQQDATLAEAPERQSV
ncbi:hypothetical protein DB30_05571 [Enhygromyxa salina]|uniref:DUF4123 domain-containing protein n=1 Tax=Enhygromyxa salina TaxID=215803 RepID=A0A0C1ZCM2_9BACT|nr:hypothetical protein DB30_05571 [Enhygromyxa salina]